MNVNNTAQYMIYVHQHKDVFPDCTGIERLCFDQQLMLKYYHRVLVKLTGSLIIDRR